MFTLTIKHEVLPDHAFFAELMIQCGLAKQAYSRLAEYARVTVERDWDATRQRPKTPLEVIADCTLFLSASATISRILFPVKASAKTRARALRERLRVEELPHLSSREVRNAFEHIDERLDAVLRDMGSQDLCQIHVARQEPPTNVVLKRFDPNTLTISFLDQSFDLNASHGEIMQLEELLASALRVRSGRGSGENDAEARGAGDPAGERGTG